MSTAKSHGHVDSIVAAIPHLYRGPGGAAAVVKDGEVVSRLAWGYANLETRSPMTPDTLLPICSISKQMVVLAAISLARNPTPAMLMQKQEPWELLTAEANRLLPHLASHPDGPLRLEDLCHMQSGIRDYWCMTSLWGAHPEGAFSVAIDAPAALERSRSFHFAPGTEFSYSNVNFYVLGRVLENVSGQSLGQLLAERVFIPAGMASATLYINTNGIPLPVAGYEGNEEKVGYLSALNRIEWAGDAGIAASLNDMIAYEKYLQRSFDDFSSSYHYMAQPQTFKDGAPVEYAFGLGRGTVAEKEAIGHGGALRGFRLNRMHVPSERTSVVVMFNHESDAGEAAGTIIKKLLGYEDPKPSVDLKPAGEWEGRFLDAGTGLNIQVKLPVDKPGQVNIHYNRGDELYNLTSPTSAKALHGTAKIDGDTLHLTRTDDNRVILARRIAKASETEIVTAPGADYTGVYRCDEVDSTFHCLGENGTLYGCFDGYLGKGPIWLMRYLGEEIWTLGNPRGMDSTPPGDWTLIFQRDAEGRVERVTMGCFLARKVEFVRQI